MPLTPQEKTALLERMRQGTATKDEVRVALLRHTGRFIPAASAHGQPETDEDRRDRLDLNPEQFQKDPSKLKQNLLQGINNIAMLNPKYNPNLGKTIAEAILPNPTGHQFGGVEARPEGLGDSRDTAMPVVSEATARGTDTGAAAGIGKGFSITEFLLGQGVVGAAKAAKETPGGMLSHPGLAFKRAHGSFARSLEESPYLTTLEMIGAGALGKGALSLAKGLTKGVTAGMRKSLQNTLGKEFNIAQDAVAAMEEEGIKAVDNLGASMTDPDAFVRAQAAASEGLTARLATFGKQIVDRRQLAERLKPFANDLARAANADVAARGKSAEVLTRNDLMRLAEQMATESRSRTMFPFSPIPRPEVPNTLRDIFAALPDRAFTGAAAGKHITADDIIEGLLPPAPKLPVGQLALPKPKVTIGGKMVEGEIGEGFVTSPGKLTTARVVPRKIKVTPGGTRDLSAATVGPRVSKGAVEFRPAISNAVPETEGSAFVGDAISETAGPLTAQVAVPEVGPAVYKSGVISDWFTRVGKKASSVAARGFVATADNVFTDHHLTAGRWMEGLRDVGLHKFDLPTREAILLELEGKSTGNALAKGASGRIRKTLDEVADLAENAKLMVEDVDGGLRPWTKRTDYSPRMVRPEILEGLYGDVEKAFKKARKKVGDGVSDERLFDAIEDLHKKGDINFADNTSRAIDHLIATNKAKNMGEAVSFLGRRTYHDKFRLFGNIDKARGMPFPVDFYERDAARLLPEYLYGASRRLAEAKHFGGRSEKLEGMLKQIAATNPKEGAYFNNVADVFLGNSDRAFMQSNPGLKKLYDAYTNYAVATKIGLGTATIPNITQFAISTLPVFGVQRTAKAALRVAFDPEYRASLRERGVVLSEAMRKIMQLEFGGKPGEVTSALLKPFEAVNKAQKMIAAAAMEDAYDDLARAALNASDTKHGEALRIFGRLGLTPEQIGTAGGKDKAIFKFAALSQLQKNVLNEPMILNNPSMQPLVLFKRFGVGQATYIHDWVWGEVKAGNVLPTLRLLAAGYAGGEFVVEAKRLTRQALSGEKQWNPQTAWWKNALRAYSEVGAIGMFADMWRIKSEMPEDIWNDIMQNVGFAASPPPLSDIFRAGAVVTTTGSDIAERGVSTGIKRNATRAISAAAGSLVGSAASRLKTAVQLQNEAVSRRSRTVDDIRSLMVTGRGKRGVELMNQWNKTFPDYFIELPTGDELLNTYNSRTAKKADIPAELLK